MDIHTERVSSSWTIGGSRIVQHRKSYPLRRLGIAQEVTGRTSRASKEIWEANKGRKIDSRITRLRMVEIGGEQTGRVGQRAEALRGKVRMIWAEGAGVSTDVARCIEQPRHPGVYGRAEIAQGGWRIIAKSWLGRGTQQMSIFKLWGRDEGHSHGKEIGEVQVYVLATDTPFSYGSDKSVYRHYTAVWTVRNMKGVDWQNTRILIQERAIVWPMKIYVYFYKYGISRQNISWFMALAKWS